MIGPVFSLLCLFRNLLVAIGPVSVADPDFPEGANRWGANLSFDQFFPKNCMKMKKF